MHFQPPRNYPPLTVTERVKTWWLEGRPLVSRWTHTKDGMDLTWVGRTANHYHRITRWVRYSWWSYVLGRRHKRYSSYTDTWISTAWCRATGHRGRVFYSSGSEPDDSCKRCGEEY